MTYVAQMLTQESIYKPSSIFCFKLILFSTHKLILLIYGDNKISIVFSLLKNDFGMSPNNGIAKSFSELPLTKGSDCANRKYF